MEGHNLLPKHHDAAKDTGQYSYLKSSSTEYVALAILAWSPSNRSSAVDLEPAHIRPPCPYKSLPSVTRFLLYKQLIFLDILCTSYPTLRGLHSNQKAESDATKLFSHSDTSTLIRFYYVNSRGCKSYTFRRLLHNTERGEV